MTSYEIWNSEVSRGVFTPRSDAFKGVATAYKAYADSKYSSLSKKVDLAKAFAKWCKEKQNWKSSTRNHNGVMERLKKELEQGDPQIQALLNNVGQGVLQANAMMPKPVVLAPPPPPPGCATCPA